MNGKQPNSEAEIADLRALAKKQAAEINDLKTKLEKLSATHKKHLLKSLAKRETFSHDPSVN